MKRKELEKYLRSMNCQIKRQGGKHTLWVNNKNKKITTVPRHPEIKKFTAIAICKQLEIPLLPAFFRLILR